MKYSFFYLILLLTIGPRGGRVLYAETKTIHLIQIIDQGAGSYVASSELKEISAAAKLAIEDFRKSNPCKFNEQFDLYTGNIEILHKKVWDVGRMPGKNVIVGLSRSSYARLAAKAAVGTPVVGISIGASLTDLQSINPHFYSVAPPWHFQWRKILEDIENSKCEPEQVLGVFDSTDIFSYSFKKAFSAAGYSNAMELNSTELTGKWGELISKHPCLFLGMNFSSSLNIINQLVTHHWRGKIWGTGDWYYFSKEFEFLLPKISPQDIKIAFPTSWKWPTSSRVTELHQRFKKLVNRSPDPVVGFTYEATTLGLYQLCDLTGLQNISEPALRQIPLLRNYRRFLPSGNLDGEIEVIQYGEPRLENFGAPAKGVR